MTIRNHHYCLRTVFDAANDAAVDNAMVGVVVANIELVDDHMDPCVYVLDILR